MKNHKIKSAFIIFTIVLLTISPNVIAQEENQSEADTVYINADQLEYKDETTILSGNLVIRKNDTTIKAQKGELFRKENKLSLEDEIKVDYEDGEVQAKNLTAFLENEKYIFENQVVLNYNLEDNENNMNLESGYLEIFGDNNSFNAKENVFIKYEGRNFKGDNAEYNGEEEIMYLTGNVMIEEGEDWVKSDKAKFFLGSEDKGYTAEGNVEIKMILD
ncbi:MAG: hypothetical protein K9K76_07050 [Halanaerobiales bacterium]|nr:hypothetical protein [Halanaerobiales bacterium]